MTEAAPGFELYKRRSPDARRRTELARGLAALGRQVAGVCAVCGAGFAGSARRRYCSRRCHDRAADRRARGEPIIDTRPRRRTPTAADIAEAARRLAAGDSRRAIMRDLGLSPRRLARLAHG